MKNLEQSLDVLNSYIRFLNSSGIRIIDENDNDYELKEVRYSPAMDEVMFSCKNIKED